MDFTSDIGPPSDVDDINTNGFQSGSHINAPSSPIKDDAISSSDVEVSILKDDDRKILELQDLKEQLLHERNNLLEEVESLRAEYNRTDISTPNDDNRIVEDDSKETIEQTGSIDDNAANVLMDLMLMANQDKVEIEEEKIVKHIDGTSDLNTELSSKYDTLPLLNMDLRLKYLQKYLYPHMNLWVDQLKDDDQRTIDATIQFGRNVTNPFSLRFEVRYNSTHEKLELFEVVDVSDNIHMLLQPWLKIKNPTILLFGLSELDRIIFKRNELLEYMHSKYGRSLSVKEPMSHLYSSCRTLIIQNKRFNREIQLIVDIRHFTQNNSSFLSIPQLEIRLLLRQNTIEVTEPNINKIYNELLQEYGLKKTLTELITYLMFLNPDDYQPPSSPKSSPS